MFNPRSFQVKNVQIIVDLSQRYELTANEESELKQALSPKQIDP
jgi:hypothetical protein